MADHIISFTIKDASWGAVKDAMIYRNGATMTNNETENYIKQLSKDRVREIVKVYKQDTKRAVADNEAQAETNAIELVDS